MKNYLTCYQKALLPFPFDFEVVHQKKLSISLEIIIYDSSLISHSLTKEKFSCVNFEVLVHHSSVAKLVFEQSIVRALVWNQGALEIRFVILLKPLEHNYISELFLLFTINQTLFECLINWSPSKKILIMGCKNSKTVANEDGKKS